MSLVQLLQEYAGRSTVGESIAAIGASPIGPQVSLPINVAEWPEGWREAYEERAAILEFDSGMERREAEQRAEEMQREIFAELIRSGGELAWS